MIDFFFSLFPFPDFIQSLLSCLYTHFGTCMSLFHSLFSVFFSVSDSLFDIRFYSLFIPYHDSLYVSTFVSVVFSLVLCLCMLLMLGLVQEIIMEGEKEDENKLDVRKDSVKNKWNMGAGVGVGITNGENKSISGGMMDEMQVQKNGSDSKEKLWDRRMSMKSQDMEERGLINSKLNPTIDTQLSLPNGNLQLTLCNKDAPVVSENVIATEIPMCKLQKTGSLIPGNSRKTDVFGRDSFISQGEQLSSGNSSLHEEVSQLCLAPPSSEVNNFRSEITYLNDSADLSLKLKLAKADDVYRFFLSLTRPQDYLLKSTDEEFNPNPSNDLSSGQLRRMLQKELDLGNLEVWQADAILIRNQLIRKETPSSPLVLFAETESLNKVPPAAISNFESLFLRLNQLTSRFPADAMPLSIDSTVAMNGSNAITFDHKFTGSSSLHSLDKSLSASTSSLDLFLSDSACMHALGDLDTTINTASFKMQQESNVTPEMSLMSPTSNHAKKIVFRSEMRLANIPFISPNRKMSSRSSSCVAHDLESENLGIWVDSSSWIEAAEKNRQDALLQLADLKKLPGFDCEYSENQNSNSVTGNSKHESVVASQVQTLLQDRLASIAQNMRFIQESRNKVVS